jgi:hypothetical protein
VIPKETEAEIVLRASPRRRGARQREGPRRAAIRYDRDAFFATRSFTDLADLNRQAAAWTAAAAADRSWVEDRARTVRQAFEDERGVLLPLAAEPFPAYERIEIEVGKTPYVRFDLNDYSIPHDRTRRTLVAFASLDEVRIVDGNEIVATHPRSWDRGQQIEQSDHLERRAAEKRSGRRVPKPAFEKAADHAHLPRIPPVSRTLTPTPRNTGRHRTPWRWATGGKRTSPGEEPWSDVEGRRSFGATLADDRVAQGASWSGKEPRPILG